MTTMDNTVEHSGELARRFLQTAVVVDDEAYMEIDGSSMPPTELVTPGRHVRGSGGNDESYGSTGGRGRHTLNAASVIDAFAELGVLGSVIGPKASVVETIRQADVVVLDWQLNNDDGKYALDLLVDLLTGERDRNSLRLVAFYTGESRLVDILEQIRGRLTDVGIEADTQGLAIEYKHGRIVLYAKAGVNLSREFERQSVAEGDLPGHLVRDFSEMTAGLLPGIALVSLTAVRESAHRVLDRFRSELDPAFLAHRACLPDPDDAERQMVNHVAEELRGIMDYAVADQSPSGAKAIEAWIRQRSGVSEKFVFGDRELDVDQTVTLAKQGLKESALKDNAFEGLSAGFGGSENGYVDERLAWIMNSRTVFNAPPPTLWLGTILTMDSKNDDEGCRHQIICMTPRCDSLRLARNTAFFFLPLVDPHKDLEQLVVKRDDEYTRYGVAAGVSDWIIRIFKPTSGKSAVTATSGNGGETFHFTDALGNRYTWRGELKPEFAQRLAQSFAKSLSRVAVDESEWLRRKSRQ